MMKYLTLSSLFFLSCLSYAQSDNETAIYVDTSIPLSSIKVLQSLHQLPKNISLKPPLVQEIKNTSVRTLFVESYHLPIVDIQLTFDAGSVRDESIEKGLFGLANLTARLLNEANNPNILNSMAEFERLGAQYSAQAYRDMFIIKLRVLSDPQYLQPAIKHLLHILNSPEFSQQNIDRLLINAQVGQQQLQENPSRTMSVRFYRGLYQQHPYAEPSTGTTQSLKRIRAQHIQTFRNQYLVKNNLNIAITGAISTIQAQAITEQITTHITDGEKASNLPDAAPLTEQKIIHIPFESSQAYVMIGHLGLKRTDPDRFAMEVGNQILGGSGFNSLLMKELREKRGFTYSASSQISSLLAQGVFSLSYSTQQEQFIPSLTVAYQTLLNFMNQPLDPQIVEDTKTGMLRAFPQIFSSNANINAQLGAIGFYNLPANYLELYPSYIQNISAEDIQIAWRKHIDPKKLLTIVVGKNINPLQIENIYRTQQSTLTNNQLSEH